MRMCRVIYKQNIPTDKQIRYQQDAVTFTVGKTRKREILDQQ